MSHLGYIGPGAGLTALTALWALVASLGAAFGIVLLWPIRRLWKRLRGARQADGKNGSDEE